MASPRTTNNLRKISSQRLPPPALFQGPPSHNTSSNSLGPTSGVSPSTQPPPLQRNHSTRPHAASFDTQASLSPFVSRVQSRGEVDPSDAIWQEMQSALAEVELSAVTSENVFGEKHSKALEDLRMKQLKLAQAWARNEAEDEVVDVKSANNEANNNISNNNNTNNSPATKKTSQSAVGSGTTERERADTEGVSYRTLDEETEKDILLARERREANDRYFNRVNNGVLDVVAKLEEVAQAMRAVERESKDIWSDSESSITTAPSTVNTSRS